jgi:hypothetical protein
MEALMTTSTTRGRDTARDAAQLRGFRADFYGCLTSWADALFELTDAALCAPGPVASVPALSLEPAFRRSHGSLYKALARGELDTEQLRDVLAAHRPASWPAVFAVDASSWARCEAETSPGRGLYFHPSRQSSGQPIVAGWSYQWITQLNWAPDSWTAPLDARRIPPTANITDATANQVTDLVERLQRREPHGPVPVFVFDAGYDPIGLTEALANTRASIVVRLRSNRNFYTDPAPHQPGQVGRPARHGARLSCAHPTSGPPPDAKHTTTDNRYGAVTVSAWHRLHPKLNTRGRWANTTYPPILRGTVVRVQVQHLPKPHSHVTRALWLWVAGTTPIDLELTWRTYLRRFDIEHTYRFVKNALGWTTPALRTPEQADRWTWLVVAAYTQLRLARGHIADLRLPWERPHPPLALSPTRVRRGFRRLRATIGTPANPPKTNTPGPGRPKGTTRPPRTRYPAIKKRPNPPSQV